MTLIYLGCVILSALIWFATSVDLGFLAPSLLIEPAWLDFSLMLFFFTAAFFGGALQLYNLADRGFSLRILIDVEQTNYHAIDAEWVVANYGGGKGLTWMYGKRIEGLLETKLAVRSIDSKAVARHLAALDHDSFEERQKARAALAALHEDVEGTLRGALPGATVEARASIQKLLQDIECDSQVWRRMRAVELLERVSTTEAIVLLERLAEGFAGSALTQEAGDALRRLRK